MAEDEDLFDADVIAAVADAHDVDADRLADVTDRHQASVEELPGVENLAYEWRKQYESPLLARTATAYYFAVPRWVWTEFGEALDVRTSMTEALQEVHRRTVVAHTDVEPQPSGAVTYVALDRTMPDSTSTDR